MTEQLYTIEEPQLTTVTSTIKDNAFKAIETGHVIYFPHYTFAPNDTEKKLLSESVLHPKHKNISYDYCQKKLGGLSTSLSPEFPQLMTAFVHRFAEYAKELVDTLMPHYTQHLRWGRTSYRPAEVKNRKTSARKDDTRIHIDAFPSTPVNGQRILRVFCNINPHNQPRTWELGEPLPDVLSKLAKSIPRYSPIRAKLLHWVKATKTLRSPYDHFMLNLHDQMKLNDTYRQTLKKQRFDFPAQSTWLVFTDQVSHAALGGQHLLEQTFYLPVSAMKNPEHSPLKQFEKFK